MEESLICNTPDWDATELVSSASIRRLANLRRQHKRKTDRNKTESTYKAQ
jgi:hypothetical protein